jgi:uncharacterized transporter YbjL
MTTIFVTLLILALFCLFGFWILVWAAKIIGFTIGLFISLFRDLFTKRK